MSFLQSTPGRTCSISGEEFLFFSGYAYLGMNHVEEFTRLVKEGIDKYGLLFPSSRISNTRLKLYEDFEAELSMLMATEETVSFSSGFLAGNAISGVLSEYKNIMIAPGTHPAIARKLNNTHNYNDFMEWADTISASINSSPDKDFVLMCDAVNILTSTIHDLSFLAKIDASKKLIVLIDNSHMAGLTGPDEHVLNLNLPKVDNIGYIFSYSLSKALNIHGGAVSCSAYFAAKLRQHPNYTAATPISPSLMYAYLNGKELYSAQKKRLFENIDYLKSKTVGSSILRNNFLLPVFTCHKENAEEYFYHKNVIISSFNYPHPSSPKIDRVVLNALHTYTDIDQLCSLL